MFHSSRTAHRTARFLSRPGVVAKSAWLSFRHHREGWWRLPLVAARNARVLRHGGATLRLEGRAFLGYQAALPRAAYFGELGVAAATIWLAGDNSLLALGDGVLLGDGVQLAVAAGGRLSIAAGTFVNPNSRVFCAESVQIGRECAISWGVQIADFDAHELGSNGVFRDQAAPVAIGDRVWIGARAIVLKGVEIGDGAVVGAGAIVTRSVAPRTVVAGNPARVIRENVDWRHVPGSASDR